MRVVLFALLIGCGVPSAGAPDGGTPSGATCPDASTLDYDTFASGFFSTYCVRCHSSTLTGAQRHGAPVGYNWDQIDSIRAHAIEMDEAAAGGPDRINRIMPPNGTVPTDAERLELGEWLACGAP